MAELLLDILKPTLVLAEDKGPRSLRASAPMLSYITYLTNHTISALKVEESHDLAQKSSSTLISLQAVSKRSHTSVVTSASQHQTLAHILPSLNSCTTELRDAIPKLDAAALRFSSTYHKSGDNDTLLRRKRAMMLSGNSDRLVDVLELPSLLSSAISNPPINYSAALDLNSHTRRLQMLHSGSALITSVYQQADDVVHKMSMDLVMSLQSPSLKLAASIRATSWLRRVLPDLLPIGSTDVQARECALEGLFLVCRMATLVSTLSALEPLKELAIQERIRQERIGNASSWSGGQQTERYLKRYIEIFREQSFTIVSMFKSMFTTSALRDHNSIDVDPLQKPPPILATFPLHLVDMLLDTLHDHLPIVKDQAARDSILAQVLYCAGSLGRLGGDFGLLLAGVGAKNGKLSPEVEWTDVVRRHRMLAGRLESVIGEYKGSKIRVS
jgi:conserved oligomeric Golgi complex subunit 8